MERSEPTTERVRSMAGHRAEDYHAEEMIDAEIEGLQFVLRCWIRSLGGTTFNPTAWRDFQDRVNPSPSRQE